jgi:hypothetical protein
VPNMFERKERKMVEFVPEIYLKSLKNLYNEIVFDCLVYTSSE